MFEYILLLELCSKLSGDCFEATRYPKIFQTHTECLITGYETGLRMSKALPKKVAEKNQLYITFACIETEGS